MCRWFVGLWVKRPAQEMDLELRNCLDELSRADEDEDEDEAQAGVRACVTMTRSRLESSADRAR